MRNRADVMQLTGTAGVTVAYSATLIRNFGYTSKQATLLNMPGGLVSIATTIIPGLAVGRGGHRWAWALGMLVPTYDFLPFFHILGHDLLIMM